VANVAGKDATFSLDNAAGSPIDLSSYIDNVSFPRSVDMYDTSALGDDAKTYIGGQSDATIALSGPWDATLDTHMEGLVGLATSSTYSHVPASGTTYAGESFLSQYDVSAPVAGHVTWSATLQCTSTITLS